MKNEIRQAGIIFYTLLCIFISAFSALAQDPENSTENFYQPVRKVDLGVPALMLEPGETYTFDVSFEPEEPFATRLIWFNTDNTVVGLNELTNTVKAFTPGTARLMAESFDGEAYASARSR